MSVKLSGSQAVTHSPLSKTVAATRSSDSSFSSVLERTLRESDRGEAFTRNAIAQASAGRDFSPSELLALQNGAYRFSEAIDLAAKFVDRISSGVKTVISGQ